MRAGKDGHPFQIIERVNRPYGAAPSERPDRDWWRPEALGPDLGQPRLSNLERAAEATLSQPPRGLCCGEAGTCWAAFKRSTANITNVQHRSPSTSVLRQQYKYLSKRWAEGAGSFLGTRDIITFCPDNLLEVARLPALSIPETRDIPTVFLLWRHSARPLQPPSRSPVPDQQKQQQQQQQQQQP
jgi:hypothetical protein